jgi:hypothetical protein
MGFYFNNGKVLTEALIISLRHTSGYLLYSYELTILGLDADGFSYTQPGHAWFDDEEFEELLSSKELQFPQEIIGMKIRLVADNERKEQDNEA